MQRNHEPIGFPIGPRSSQVGGPRASADVGPLLVSTFFSSVVGARPITQRGRVQRSPRA
jgi:hypothetical protein